MFKLSTEQHTAVINNTHIGGQPGEWPTVLCGSIFFAGHKIVKDPEAGVFDEQAALELLKTEGRLADEYGLGRMVDVIGETGTALKSYVKFVLENTDCPLLVDSSSVRALLDAFQYFAGSQVMERLVYNSIDPRHTEAEFAEIAKLGIKNAVVLAFSPQAIRPQDKLRLLSDPQRRTGLVERARSAGVENILVDVGVLDLQSTAWSALAIREVKERLGLPCGCAPSNALFSWQKHHRQRLAREDALSATGAAVYSLPINWGADFLFYGPMRCASWVYPACAVADALVAYGAKLSGTRPRQSTHPLHRI